MKYLISVLAFFSSFVAASSQPIDVTVGVSDGFPVYYYDPASQSFRGPMIDSFRAICNEAELNCVFRSLPKKRVEQELISGSLHFGSVINSASQLKMLENRVHFTEFNVPAKLGMYSTLPEDQIPTELESYYGESIICVFGWSLSILPGVWEAEKQEKLTVFPSATIESATKMLLLGRAKFLYANKQKMDVFLSDSDNVHFKQFKTFNQTFSLSKSAPNFEEIKTRVEQAISRLLSDGTIDRTTGLLMK
ncbi:MULTISPECIES: transporter substrate-binding domain-containing protein [Vibrio]|uniref:transporter substrate-binding domain-containing protein n=1 Tax=Vibrio TaxID=662 RepID=UPI00142ED0D1|nr:MULTISPECIES: transporter substrate-binding domain-containing protein [Vibrio]